MRTANTIPETWHLAVRAGVPDARSVAKIIGSEPRPAAVGTPSLPHVE
jgi:hypothetical protein